MTKTPEEKTTNLSKNLKRYFATTPREQVLKDWEQTAKYDNVDTDIFFFFNSDYINSLTRSPEEKAREYANRPNAVTRSEELAYIVGYHSRDEELKAYREALKECIDNINV